VLGEKKRSGSRYHQPKTRAKKEKQFRPEKRIQRTNGGNLRVGPERNYHARSETNVNPQKRAPKKKNSLKKKKKKGDSRCLGKPD